MLDEFHFRTALLLRHTFLCTFLTVNSFPYLVVQNSTCSFHGHQIIYSFTVVIENPSSSVRFHPSDVEPLGRDTQIIQVCVQAHLWTQASSFPIGLVLQK